MDVNLVADSGEAKDKIWAIVYVCYSIQSWTLVGFWRSIMKSVAMITQHQRLSETYSEPVSKLDLRI